MPLPCGILGLTPIYRSWKVCRKKLPVLSVVTYSWGSNVTQMLKKLEWPSLEQRRAEARLSLFHRIVHDKVDVNGDALMKRSTRPSRRKNCVQYIRPQTSKDCFKYSFIPRTIVQWNNIAAVSDQTIFKSIVKTIDLGLDGTTYKY